jgi:hypothetical protein
LNVECSSTASLLSPSCLCVFMVRFPFLCVLGPYIFVLSFPLCPQCLCGECFSSFQPPTNDDRAWIRASVARQPSAVSRLTSCFSHPCSSVFICG